VHVAGSVDGSVAVLQLCRMHALTQYSFFSANYLHGVCCACEL